ncbi:hypothetical protein SODALDRAFT_11882 [Sodiomyces alkalinus F11]|uniref:Small EDRK-rich factor-like N-terminal domain-containing protein n=1 Tax=Sodiomyces alkalinus (strain CBS 110278 / VKM F-3762 / F11) TaxID=1314773 RepID=A0A3N2Q675_SODAK|nr:hypothetical protein SODALDRAFT_11882 [Sodiomyces alkalinus F11]ROT42283.1 hypothetical protein SODALDRAFT_11882 [Sodiomyces alkalinus F11]
MGNGARAQQKRERNQKDTKVAKSQLKVVRSVFVQSPSDNTIAPPSLCLPILGRFLSVSCKKKKKKKVKKKVPHLLTHPLSALERRGQGYPVHCLQGHFPQNDKGTSVRSRFQRHLPLDHRVSRRLTFAGCSLTEHADNKHRKTLAECFPSFVAPA